MRYRVFSDGEDGDLRGESELVQVALPASGESTLPSPASVDHA